MLFRPFLVDEEARYSPRPGVEVFVRAPHREIDVPAVQRHRNISNPMCKVPAHRAALLNYMHGRGKRKMSREIDNSKIREGM